MSNTFYYNDQSLSAGDLVRVHQRVLEGGKERTQIFEGLIIAIRGANENLMFTVRKISSGNIGVERIFPLQSPWLTKIELKKKGTVRRAKLYYLRTKTRKQTTQATQASSQ